MQDLDRLTGRLLEQVRAGRDALVTGAAEDGRALLAAVGEGLAGECRVVPVAAGPQGLSLSGLMAQIAGEADLTAQDDAVLALGYRRLAVPEAPGQRIALLVGGADRLQAGALRFIQHVAGRAPALLLVLAGGARLTDVLAEAEFAPLRERLGGAAITSGAAPAVPAPAVPAPEAASPRPRVSTVSQRRRSHPLWRPLWATAGLGLAASVGVAAWLERPAPPPAVAAVPVAAVPVAAAPAPAQAPATQEASLQSPTAPVPEAPAPSPPVAAAPAPTPQAAEPERPAPRPRARAAARASRQPHGRGFPRSYWSEPEEGWAEAAPAYEPGPSGSRSGYGSPYAGRDTEGPSIGTYTADRDGIRTFHYGR